MSFLREEVAEIFEEAATYGRRFRSPHLSIEAGLSSGRPMAAVPRAERRALAVLEERVAFERDREERRLASLRASAREAIAIRKKVERQRVILARAMSQARGSAFVRPERLGERYVIVPLRVEALPPCPHCGGAREWRDGCARPVLHRCRVPA